MGVLSTFNENGFVYYDYPTTLEYVKNIFRGIYGEDIYLESDSKDGQLCATLATGFYDNNQTVATILNSLSPVYAQGNQLSSSVLINGITRKSATNSTVTLTLTGDVGTVISGASAKDSNNNIWDISDGLINESGVIDLFSVCRTSGAISALANTITNINTPILGWNTVTNDNPATLGQDEESDYDLRQRQKISVSLPSQTVLGGLKGGLYSIPYVTRVETYENFTDSIDANGLPPHSICAVVEGGNSQLIGDEISIRKTIGCNTYGDTTITSIDSVGIETIVKYETCKYVQLGMNINITALSGFVNTTKALIQESLQNYINGLNIGEDVLYSRLFTYANLNGSDLSLTYDIVSLEVGELLSTYGTSNISVPFNSASKIELIDIVITV